MECSRPCNGFFRGPLRALWLRRRSVTHNFDRREGRPALEPSAGSGSESNTMSKPKTTKRRKRAPGRSFSKKSPDVRRQELIDATFRCVCRYGTEQMSVRLIAQEAGLSLGMVRHHFRSKDELLAATLRHLSSKVQDQIAAAMERAD